MRHVLAAALVVVVAPFAVADEADVTRALDEAEAQLAHHQWDLCRDALQAAVDGMKALAPAARAAAQKRHGALRERCEAGQKGYKSGKLVQKIKSALATARQ